ncbi:MAG: hypothetical protein AAB923_03445 [Patescibacteria group bacterium]
MSILGGSELGGLEAVTYVTGADLPDIVPGAKATVGAGVMGTITRAAQALDPVTKKAEIRIGIPDAAGLVSGQSVTITIERAVKKGTDALFVPLSALKITPESPQIFTVDDGKAVPHPVSLGALRGTKVEIVAGATADMRIIEDARGIKEGQEIIVKD